jgi:short-subunit dehydrogenase
MKKTVLVTGCSSGIGKATCCYLQSKGFRVFATVRKKEHGDELQKAGIEYFLLDLDNSEQIAEVVTVLLERTKGSLYGLINNAGYGVPGALEDLDRDKLRRQFETNVFGPQELTNKLIPVFKKQGYGRIIYISSVLGLIAMPFRGAYIASKYALEGLADTLRLELHNTNIFVTLIEPGPIVSKFRDRARNELAMHVDLDKSAYKTQYEAFLKNRPKREKYPFSKKPEAVAEKIYKALTSDKPKPHYFVTAPAHFFAILKRLLPSRWLDKILARAGD